MLSNIVIAAFLKTALLLLALLVAVFFFNFVSRLPTVNAETSEQGCHLFIGVANTTPLILVDDLLQERGNTVWLVS